MPSINTSYSHSGSLYSYTDSVLGSTSTSMMDNGVTVRTSVSTPGYGKARRSPTRSKLPPPNLPDNPFSFYKVSRKGGYGEYSTYVFSPPALYTLSGNFRNYFGPTTGGVVFEPDADDRQDAIDKTSARILDKLKGQKVNVAQAFAERKQTADLIANSAKKIASSIIALKKGNFRAAARALAVPPSRRKSEGFTRNYKNDPNKAISSAWLELQYGWKPLLSDIYGSAEWLAQKNSREVRQKVSTRISREYVVSERAPLGSGYDADVVTSSLTRYDESVVVWFSTTGAELASLKEAGITNPALLAWELLPYSFVVDWFLPVGSYLSSLDSTLGLSFQKGSRTYFVSGNGFQRIEALNRRGANSITTANIRSSVNWTICNRTPLSGFPSINFPSFKNPFSFTHAANAIALLRMAFSKKPS